MVELRSLISINLQASSYHIQHDTRPGSLRSPRPRRSRSTFRFPSLRSLRYSLRSYGTNSVRARQPSSVVSLPSLRSLHFVSFSHLRVRGPYLSQPTVRSTTAELFGSFTSLRYVHFAPKLTSFTALRFPRSVPDTSLPRPWVGHSRSTVSVARYAHSAWQTPFALSFV